MRATGYGWNDCMDPCNTHVDGNVQRSYYWRHFTWGLPPRPTSGRRTSPFESVTVVQHHRPTSPSTPPNPRCHPAIRSPHYQITSLSLFHTISSHRFTNSSAHKPSQPRRDPTSSSSRLGDSRSGWIAWSLSSHIYCMNQHHHIHVVDFRTPFYQSQPLSIMYYVMLHMTYNPMCMISEAG